VNLCVAALVAAVVPLAIAQIPNAIAWSFPAQFAATRPNVLASLLRAAGLALPAMAVAVPFGGLAIRRFRAGPVLLAGLLAIGAADALGEGTRTVLLIGVDRSLHGLGAGVSMAAVAAIVAERRHTTRFLAGWWACAVVVALAAAPALMRHRVSVGGWRAALQPYPWLTGAALALAALYPILADGTARTAVRGAFPAAERVLLALLAAPVAGMCAVTLAVTYRGNHAVVAAAIADAIALAGVTVMAVRASTAGRLVAVCAVIGFTVAPAADAVTVITPPGQHGWAAGSAVTHLGVLALLCVPLAGGLAAALAAALRGAGSGGAVCGVALLLAGVVGGSLAAGAVQLQALQGARTAAAAHAALVAATARWAFLAAAVAAAVALVMAVAPRRRGPVRAAGPAANSGAPPVRRAGGTPDRG
jgi:hypothetical protein